MKKLNKTKWLCGFVMAVVLGMTGCDEDSTSESNVTCDDKEKPATGTCTCVDNAWKCEETPAGTCDDKEKPVTGTCTCVDNAWKCEESTGGACDEECYGTCVDGVCKPYGESSCQDCVNSCDSDGKCLCSDACPDQCNADGSCPGEVDHCPAECPNDCDSAGVCYTCSSDCELGCNDDGSCVEEKEPEDICPAECPDQCDDQGKCPDVTCAVSCQTECGDDGKCVCPSTCKNGCEADGACACPSTCINGCNEDGACTCPASCSTSCDDNGACKCSAACADSCNKDGECPAKCGDIDVEKIKFGQVEVDLVLNATNNRDNAKSAFYIQPADGSAAIQINKTSCADKIKYKSSNKDIISVSDYGGGAEFKANSVGEATITATFEGTDLKAEIKVRALNFKKLSDAIENHVSSHTENGNSTYRYTLYKSSRVAQGFDIVNDNYYFSQLNNLNSSEYKDGGVYIFKYKAKDSEVMYLAKSSHGQNISFEDKNGKLYVWAGNYGAVESSAKDEKYKFPQTLSRVEFSAKKLYPGDIKEHYYIVDKNSYYYGMDPGLDIKNNRIAVRAAYKNPSGADYVKMKIYKYGDLSKVKEKSIKLKTVERTSGANKGTYKPSETGQITVKDLSTIDTYKEFVFNNSKGEKRPYNYPQQGFAINNGIVYALEGLPEKDKSKTGIDAFTGYSRIYVAMYTLEGGLIGEYELRTSSGVVSKSDGKYFLPKELNTKLNFDSYKLRALEPEGIRAKDGKIYLNVSARYKKGSESSPYSRQVILEYDLTKK